ncbi:hypothetical protein E2C01_055548 [Portunus trituberculatus]|uniref:Uncharacterized protein n=1 Tax=Portunus trituberculatus TaxID=210409 RepID=A0A5B7GV32_PORTR|nr:hypothetical protein [Portunus trituberculatus]
MGVLSPRVLVWREEEVLRGALQAVAVVGRRRRRFLLPLEGVQSAAVHHHRSQQRQQRRRQHAARAQVHPGQRRQQAARRRSLVQAGGAVHGAVAPQVSGQARLDLRAAVRAQVHAHR